jgi:monovalent cation/hydrogen antiporter
MASAWFTAWRDFRADIRIIMQLAVGAVVFTTLVVGVVAHLVQPPLSKGSLLRPRRNSLAARRRSGEGDPPGIAFATTSRRALEGESLVNDASRLVLFRLAVAATLTGVFSLTHSDAFGK